VAAKIARVFPAGFYARLMQDSRKKKKTNGM